MICDGVFQRLQFLERSYKFDVPYWHWNLILIKLVPRNAGILCHSSRQKYVHAVVQLEPDQCHRWMWWSYLYFSKELVKNSNMRACTCMCLCVRTRARVYMRARARACVCVCVYYSIGVANALPYAGGFINRPQQTVTLHYAFIAEKRRSLL